MSTDVIQNTNRLIDVTIDIQRFIRNADFSFIRSHTLVNWKESLLIECEPSLRALLDSMGVLTHSESGDIVINKKGRVFLGKILIGLDDLLQPEMLINSRYRLIRQLAAGKNSITYQADDLRLGRNVVLKFFRFGRGEEIIHNLPKIGAVQADPILVAPLDVFTYQVPINSVNQPLVNVIVFPYVEGCTLREYLDTENNASPLVLLAFIEQTCNVLRALERSGLHHGDLHSNNILVSTDSSGRAAFRVIDVSYGADLPSEYEIPTSDLEGFKFILRVAVDVIQRKLTRISLRRYLGARIFTLVTYILENTSITFEEICKEVSNAAQYSEFNRKKNEFIRSKFKPPHDFGILRYEEFSNPNLALSLFLPYPELFQRLCEFGSTALYGHRGTGKSTYLAAMNFFPEASQPKVDFRENFGILFSCRQGEFRKFNTRLLSRIDAVTSVLIKDIVITKIIRRTLNLLSLGIQHKKLSPPKTISAISSLLLPRLQIAKGLISSHQTSEVESLKATVLQAEVNAIDRLFAREAMPLQSRLLDEHFLCDFFMTVRTAFSELNQVRFSVLFDDAGAPNIPKEMQGVICDLMVSTNSVFCVKISAEKRTFELLTTEKKPVERVHDVRVYTISDYFSMGGGFTTERRTIEQYFRDLVNLRLKVCGFPGKDIVEYLGEEAMKVDELVSRLVSRSRGVPVYGGWQVVWQIADRTMRHLIEMISAIFDESKTTPDKAPSRISTHVQSRQIVRFSTEKLKGLMLLPGNIDIGGKKFPLGKKLYDFAASYGRVANYYLKSSAVDTDRTMRFDERLAIEIDNTLNLGRDGQRMLDELIRFAVLDDEKMTTAFDDGTRKPIYIFNRVYCPALRISFRRDAHWRLSSKRFEQFLLSPTEFVGTDQRLVKFLRTSTADTGGLFKFDEI